MKVTRANLFSFIFSSLIKAKSKCQAKILSRNSASFIECKSLFHLQGLCMQLQMKHCVTSRLPFVKSVTNKDGRAIIYKEQISEQRLEGAFFGELVSNTVEERKSRKNKEICLPRFCGLSQLGLHSHSRVYGSLWASPFPGPFPWVN